MSMDYINIKLKPMLIDVDFKIKRTLAWVGSSSMEF
jgi:hypothetical protein